MIQNEIYYEIDLPWAERWCDANISKVFNFFKPVANLNNILLGIFLT